MNIGQEFQNYYVKHLGKGSLDLHNFSSQIQSSMTPYILEEREMRATQIDIFSRLMRDRIIWVAGPVDDRMSTIVQAQLMFMDNVDKADITMHIDSPGGSVKSGLSMVDVMNYIACDIRTVNTGMAASMGSVLLGAGTKGKRSSLRFSRTMLHQCLFRVGEKLSSLMKQTISILTQLNLHSVMQSKSLLEIAVSSLLVITKLVSSNLCIVDVQL